jgi:hypothetical protein
MSLYQRVLDQNPNYVPAILALADLKWSSGDRGAAAALYRRALQMGISGPNADRARERSGESSTPPPPATDTAAPPPTSPPTAPPTSTADGPNDPPPPSTGGAVIDGEPAGLPKPTPAVPPGGDTPAPSPTP